MFKLTSVQKKMDVEIQLPEVVWLPGRLIEYVDPQRPRREVLDCSGDKKGGPGVQHRGKIAIASCCGRCMVHDSESGLCVQV